jgi:hypothetical protein
MAAPLDRSLLERNVVRAREVVALEVRSGSDLWCFAWVLVLAGVPSVLLGESSFVVLWSGSDLLPEFASLERATCVAGWIETRGKATGHLLCSIGGWTVDWCE